MQVLFLNSLVVWGFFTQDDACQLQCPRTLPEKINTQIGNQQFHHSRNVRVEKATFKKRKKHIFRSFPFIFCLFCILFFYPSIFQYFQYSSHNTVSFVIDNLPGYHSDALLLLHHWLAKENTAMTNIHDYSSTIGLRQIFPNSPIFTYLASCRFAGLLYISHFWNI